MTLEEAIETAKPLIANGGRAATAIRLILAELDRTKGGRASMQARIDHHNARADAAEARANAAEASVKRLEEALRQVEMHDGPGYPQGTCAKIARAALTEGKK